MPRPDLLPDCGRCAALCCVATSFERSEDFAFDKPAGVPCRFITAACRCAIHDQLVERGFRGCAVYDCHGAGQRVTQAFAGVPDAEPLRQEAFLALRVVHELLWLLTEAAPLCPSSHPVLQAQLERQIQALDALAGGPMQEIAELDLRPHRSLSQALLRQVGEALGGSELRPLHRIARRG